MNQIEAWVKKYNAVRAEALPLIEESFDGDRKAHLLKIQVNGKTLGIGFEKEEHRPKATFAVTRGYALEVLGDPHGMFKHVA